MNKVVCGRLVGFVLGISALVGCARVTVRPASKDSNERAGIPFYMQRPYVAIKQEIPAEGEEGYLVATLKGDKLKFKSIPFCVQSCLKQMGAKLTPNGEFEVDVEFIRVLKAPEDHMEWTARGAYTPNNPLGKPNDVKELDTSKSNEAKTSASLAARFDPAVPNVIDASEFVSVVFLPDLDEKYTIDADAGLGVASLSAAMGPGGVLNNFQANSDNTELGKFVFDTLGKFRDLALQKNKFDFSSNPAAPDDGNGPHGKSRHGAAGQQDRSMLVKYIYVGFATPGLYPILKNKEYQCRLNGTPNDPYLVPATWPDTRYAYRVRRELGLYISDPGGTPMVTPVSADELSLLVAKIDANPKKSLPFSVGTETFQLVDRSVSEVAGKVDLSFGRVQPTPAPVAATKELVLAAYVTLLGNLTDAEVLLLQPLIL